MCVCVCVCARVRTSVLVQAHIGEYVQGSVKTFIFKRVHKFQCNALVSYTDMRTLCLVLGFGGSNGQVRIAIFTFFNSLGICRIRVGASIYKCEYVCACVCAWVGMGAYTRVRMLCVCVYV